MRDWQETVRAHLVSARLDPAQEAEIVEEFALHLEDRYAALKSSGVEDGEAERAVLAELSDAESLARAIESSARPASSMADGHFSGSGSILGDLWSDLRYAARGLRRSPSFAATAVLCLGLGIGAISTVFGVVDAFFFRPPPGVGAPDGLVRPYLAVKLGGFPISYFDGLPYPLYEEIRQQTRSLDDLAGYALVSASVGAGLEARPVGVLLVTGNYFSVLRVRPALGQLFGADEPSPGAVVSYSYWRNELGGEPAAIGTTLTLNGHSFTIVGVLPKGFDGIDVEPPVSTEGRPARLNARSIWVAYPQSPELLAAFGLPVDAAQARLNSDLKLIARLAPGVAPAQAQAELEPLIVHALRSSFGAKTEAHLELGPILTARGPHPSQQAALTRWLAIAAVLVFAIACANTANLLLTRALVRRKEIAIRLAIGASRGRLVRQLLAESVLLAACGAVLGLFLASWGAALAPLGGLPRLSFFAGGRVFLLAAAAMILCVAACGAAPALAATRSTLGLAMKSPIRGAAGGRSRTRGALMVMQVALATLLLVGAGLFVHGLLNLYAIDPGMDLEHLETVSVDLRSAGYDDAAAARFIERALGPLRRVPGVREATLGYTPFFADIALPYSVPDSAAADTRPALGLAESLRRAEHGASAFTAAGGPHYFATLGTPILEGRDFNEQDRAGSTPVAIVNRAFAERDWPGKSALGRCIDMYTSDGIKCFRVIGVAADAKYSSLDEPRRAAIFRALNQLPGSRLYQSQILIRAAVPPAEVAGGVRAALAELDPNLPYVDIKPLTAQLSSRLEAPRLGASLLSAFGTLALVLAAVGLYGVVSYAVEQRRHEIGIRMALGAETRDVLALVVRQGLQLTAAGLAIGLLCSLGAAHLIAHLLHGIGAADPLAFASAAALFAAVGLLASFIPARRAARVDPAVTLRDE